MWSPTCWYKVQVAEVFTCLVRTVCLWSFELFNGNWNTFLFVLNRFCSSKSLIIDARLIYGGVHFTGINAVQL